MSVVGARVTEMKIRQSALKHGCTPDDIAHALATAWWRRQVGEEPTKWLYIGFDTATRSLEIVTVEGDDGDEVTIHAMKLRRKHYPEGGGS